MTMAAISFVLSLRLRLGEDFQSASQDFLIIGTVMFTLVSASVFWSLRLYRGIWRYASLSDLVAIARAVTYSILIFLPIMYFLTRLQAMPRSMMVINWFVLLILLGGPRVLYRLMKDGRLELRSGEDQTANRRVPVLLVGIDSGAEMFIRAMDHRPTAQYRVVGIIDDRGTHVGRNIRGIEVLGTLDDLPQVVEKLDRSGRRPRRLILTGSKIDGVRLRRLLDEGERLGLSLARAPKATDFKPGLGDEPEIQPVAIEDLLGRAQTVLDRDAMRALVAGRRVMVTGAGGTIGCELVRQIAELEPAHVALLDASEFNLYSIDLEVSERQPSVSRRAYFADVRERERLAAIVSAERPDLVFHAAAMKHLPIVEAFPDDGVLTNVIGTRNVAEACRAAGVAAMVLISTDKAVNPTSVMGASKRLAEAYCQTLDQIEQGRSGGTRFVTVRFGNVLGSTGSIVPLFQRQVAAGGPLTVTHPDVRRYFMTVREAVELVLQATALGVKGAHDGGRIFVLDMGEPVRIQDLARQMILLAGKHPDTDIRIVYTGLRPGEKLDEELFHPGEAPAPTSAKGVLLATPRTADHAFIARGIEELEETSRAGRSQAALALLARLVPEYQTTLASNSRLAATR